jgi:putative serine protease PepD
VRQVIDPPGEARPDVEKAPQRPRGRAALATTGVVLLSAVVAAGVTLGLIQLDQRNNTQQPNLRGVTLTEDSAIVQAAAKARPAVVSVVIETTPPYTSGSGYLATGDGYIVTNISVIARANTITVLVPGDSKAHNGRLVDYDCQTGVAVLKVDQVSGLPTLAFADPGSLLQGQVLVAVSGPLSGSAVSRGIISALHRPISVTDPAAADRTQEISDTILVDPTPQPYLNGAPLVNVGGQVVGIAMTSSDAAGFNGFALSAAGVQDDVQQILQTGQLVVPSMGVTSTDITPEEAALSALPQGSKLLTIDKGGPADVAGLKPGDIITQLDDVTLDPAHPLRLLLRSRFHANQRVTVTYTRGSTSTQVQLTLTAAHPTCA